MPKSLTSRQVAAPIAATNDDDVAEVEENSDPLVEEYYPVEYAISSYGADYPVDGLVKRIKNGSILIPKFQRNYVWNIHRASRFVESLLIGLPVPAVFLYKESDSGKLLVIDGQQRLRTLQFFYEGIFKPSQSAFRLVGVQEQYKNATYDTLNAAGQRRLDDSIIHAIVVKQDEPTEDGFRGGEPSSVYHIFERLNTGGMLLHPQEIRACVHHGDFIELLEELNSDNHWRHLFGKNSARMRDRELILRFFALYFDGDDYSQPMKEFLNLFSMKRRKMDSSAKERFTTLFKQVVKTIDVEIGPRSLRTTNAVNAALCDSTMVGIAKRLERGALAEPSELPAIHEALIGSDEFKRVISSGTTQDAAVKTRLRLAIQAFGGAR